MSWKKSYNKVLLVVACFSYGLNIVRSDTIGAPMKLVVIGGVAGGMSAAARARRLNEAASIVVFEKGPDPSFANCGMPYYLGGEIKDRNALNVQTPKSLKDRLEIDVRTRTEVIKIDCAAKIVTVRCLSDGKEYDEPYDHLILSLGAAPFRPPIPGSCCFVFRGIPSFLQHGLTFFRITGIDRPGNLILRNLEDMDMIQEWILQNSAKTAVVCGAGFIGVEMAEQLKRRGMAVALVEGLPQIMAPLDPEMAAQLQVELERNGVEVLTSAGIAGFEASAAGARGSDVVLQDGRRLPADVVILGLGVRPDTALAKVQALPASWPPRAPFHALARARTHAHARTHHHRRRESFAPAPALPPTRHHRLHDFETGPPAARPHRRSVAARWAMGGWRGRRGRRRGWR